MTVGPGSTPPTQPPLPGTQGPATPDRTRRIDALAAYFRTNRDGFTEEALRRSAAEAGYEPRDIDAAWAVAAIPATGGGGSSLVTVLLTIAFVVVTYGIALVLGAVPETSNLAFPAVGVMLVLGILGWLTMRESRPALASALKFGVIIAVVLPVVLTLAVIGLCFVLAAGFRVAG
jgi:hypothetical protein